MARLEVARRIVYELYEECRIEVLPDRDLQKPLAERTEVERLSFSERSRGGSTASRIVHSIEDSIGRSPR